MQILKHIATSFVDSGGVLSLSASGMVATFSIVYQVPIQLSLLLIAFFVTFFSYYINRLAEINEDRLTHPHRTRFVEENKWVAIFSGIMYILALGLALNKNLPSFFIILIPPIIVAIYSFRVHPKFKRLKEITLGKNVIVSLIWASVALLVALYNNLPYSTVVYIMAIFLFLRFFINTVIFDMRDEVADKLLKIPTLPVVLGKAKTMYLLLIVNTATALFLLLSSFEGWVPWSVNFLNLITFYSYYVILKSTDTKIDQRFLCDVLADGEFVIRPFLLLIPFL